MQDTQDHPQGLGAIRCSADGETAPRTRPATQASRALAAFALTTDVEALVAACLAELRHVIPQLRPWHGRLTGHRVLGAHSPLEHGEAAAGGVIRGVTRIDLDFHVEADDATPRTVALACRSTVRGRDRQTTRMAIAVPEGEAGHEARRRVADWIEAEVLAFADEWYAARHAEALARP